MKHVRLTSKSMPATASHGGITTKPAFLGFWPRNDFSFFPFNWLIVPLTGIQKRVI